MYQIKLLPILYMVLKDRNLQLMELFCSFVLNLFQELEWKPSPKISLNQKVNYLQNPEDSYFYSYEILTAFNYRLSDFLGLEIRYSKNYDNNVQNGSGDDTRLRNALTFYF